MMRSLINFVIFLYGLGQYIFIHRLSDGKNSAVLIVLWITAIFALLPSQTIISYLLDKMNNKWFNKLLWGLCESVSRNFKIVRNEEDTYKKWSPSFKPDYVENNPVHFLGVSLAFVLITNI